MKLHELSPKRTRKALQRIGRSGKRGSYSGRGVKGQRSRSGHQYPPGGARYHLEDPEDPRFPQQAEGGCAEVFNLGELAAKFENEAKARRTPLEVSYALLKTAKLIKKDYKGTVKSSARVRSRSRSPFTDSRFCECEREDRKSGRKGGIVTKTCRYPMERFLQIFKVKELRNKILIVLGLLVAYRVLAAIPIPGVNAQALQNYFNSNQLLGFLNFFSGGGLANLSVVMLGVGPYITSTIVMQLMTIIFPKMKEMYYEEGARGQAKFNQYSRMLTVPFALRAVRTDFLSLLMSQGVIPRPDPFNLIRNVIVITCGSMIALWLGELISEQKVGNGISLIILAGIISRIPSSVGTALAVVHAAAVARPISDSSSSGLLLICGHRVSERRRTENSCRLCAACARQQNVRRLAELSAAQGEPGGHDPADFCHLGPALPAIPGADCHFLLAYMGAHH